MMKCCFPISTAVLTYFLEERDRPIEALSCGRVLGSPTTHSKAESQPVSSLIHCGGFPATRTGTQTASLHILIGNTSQFARLISQFSSSLTLPALKSICTTRPLQKP